jgi:recombination associated protein RdgC
MDNQTQIEAQLEKILPEDITRTLESAYHVIFQGDHDKMEDLLRHGGALLKKTAQRFTTTQLILGIAAIAAVAVVVVNQVVEAAGDDHDTSAEPVEDNKKNKPGKAGAQSQGNQGQNS